MANTIQGRFADQNDIVLTGQVISSNNNQTTLNAALAETDHIRATTVALQATGLLATTANPLPNVTGTVQSTIGAALGGIGQQGSPSTDPGGGGNPPCFIGSTLFSLWEGQITFEELYHLDKKPVALSFYGNDRVQGEIGNVTRTWVEFFSNVTYEDDSFDRVTPDHPYFNGVDYTPIKFLNEVRTEDNEALRIVSQETVYKGVYVYNAHIKIYQNYCANRRRVHNLCPINGGGEQVQ